MVARGRVEILVVALQEAIVRAKRHALARCVGAEHDPVLILQKKLASRVRLPAEFGNPGGNVDEQVGILIEPFRHGCQILGVVVEVGPEERRLGMPGDQANELGQQFLLGRIILAVKQPVGMLVQLVPALVVRSKGVKNAAGSAVWIITGR